MADELSICYVTLTALSEQEHKKLVKEEKREQRKVKMPKHVKKRLVAASARHKK